MKIGIYARGLSEETGGPKQYIESTTTAMINEIMSDMIYREVTEEREKDET